jgi:hypothetical protein
MMNDQDDLARLVTGIKSWGYVGNPVRCAKTILAAGFRRSVTSKEIEQAAEVAYIADNRVSPWSIKPWNELHDDIHREYRRAARITVTAIGLFVDETEERSTQPSPEVPCPEGYHWIGQSFRYCDKCGLPAWEHAGRAALPEKVSTDYLFGDSDPAWVLKPWKPGEREACFRKWSEPGDTFVDES